MAYTFDDQIFSDLHKDAYGYRPRNHEYYTADDQRKQQIWDDTICDLNLEMAATERRYNEAIEQFENNLISLINCGAGDRNTAIRWFVDSLGLTEFDRSYGASYICFELGIPYSMGQVFVDAGASTHVG